MHASIYIYGTEHQISGYLICRLLDLAQFCAKIEARKQGEIPGVIGPCWQKKAWQHVLQAVYCSPLVDSQGRFPQIVINANETSPKWS